MTRRLAAIACLALLAAGPLDPSTPDAAVPGLRDAPITGDRLAGFVLPIVPLKTDLSMKATRAFKWKVDDTQRLALEGDVRITLGGYAFTTRDALVWINRIPSADGVITQVALWFPQVAESTRGAGLGVEGRNVLVTGSLRGAVRLAVPVVVDEAPSRLTTAPGDARVAEYLKGIAAAPATLATQPRIDAPKPPPEPALAVASASKAPTASTPGATPAAVSVPTEGTPATRAGDVLTFAGRDVRIDEKANVVVVQGGAQVDVLSRDPSLRNGEMRLSAERAVVFLREGALKRLREATGRADAGDVEGVYLEGDVTATDGSYAVRGAQVYYDVATARAAALQAVLRTTMRNGMPVISRAAEVRQVARDQFEARDASVSISEFHTPHLSVGAEKVTVTKGTPDDPTTTVEAQHVTFRAGSMPFFYWPYLSGEADRALLPQVIAGYNDYQGVTVGTRWDLWKLVGWQPPVDVQAELSQDIYTKNGYGLGTRFSGTPGDLSLYGFYDLQNQEQSSSGVVYESPIQWRGLIDGGSTVALDQGSILQGQLAWTSDGAWVSTFRQQDFANRREYETSGFVKLQSGNSAFDALVKYDLDRYVINSWMLGTRPYSVSKFPEASYRRYGDTLFDGQLTWTQEYNMNAMAMQLEAGTPQDLAAQSDAFSTQAGFGQNSSVNALYSATGYNEETYVRGFTRHEFALPMGDDVVHFTPFLQGTAIGYMLNDFQDYALQAIGPGSPGGTFRGIAGGGTRMSAEFVQNFDGVQSSALDLNRLRWVVQPNSTLWGGYDTGDNGQYPIFDQDVEGATGAAAAQLGVTQRWQTYRGGPGDWRSVDWAMLDAGVVVNNQDADFQRPGTANGLGSVQYFQSPTPQFFSWRPELSQWGNHAYARGNWAMSSTFTAYGSTTLLFEDRNTALNPGMDNFARGSVGLSMQHSPDTSFFCEYRMINNFYDSTIYPNDELLQPGVMYRIGKLYSLSAGPQIDLNEGDLRALSAALTRSLPDFNLTAQVGYSAITDQYSFGMSLSIPANARPGASPIGVPDASVNGGPWSGLNSSF